LLIVQFYKQSDIDIDNNKRILNSANKESLVEVLLENNADN